MKYGRVLSWESHLILRAADGDEVAFDLLSELYRQPLLAQAMRMLRNADDANDAVQETFLKALRAIKEFDPERPHRPWLCRICNNCCVDLVRHRRFSGENLENHEHMIREGDEVESQAAGSIRRGQLFDAISHLPEKYRNIILMRHFRHMEVTEIALALDRPEGTIKSWLFRARAMLKKELIPALG